MSEAKNSVNEGAHAYRYDAAMAGRIEEKWQLRWRDEHTFEAPNPAGDLSDGFDRFAGKAKQFIMDMFPYPSGSGLHVGHPLGFIATDVYARFQRMAGNNVLHTMGFDAFGLPAEQYAVQTGKHPRITTEENIANMSRQLRRLGLGHDPRRSFSTTDVDAYRWTQWIFLQIFESWCDPITKKARAISELIAELEGGKQQLADGRDWNSLDEREKQLALLDYRLAYVAEAPVNWCPALGTVLANEEVTNEGRSERGNFPVYRRPMRQWMMRITAFADRLIDDLDALDWPESVKLMQRNWIGRSSGARVRFEVDGHDEHIDVFTTRPDTLFGATYMVLSPEHPLVDKITASEWPAETKDAWKGTQANATPGDAVAAYVKWASHRSDLERTSLSKEKTGVFTGAFAVNPVNNESVPVFVADYVLMGYGTGAIMAVPAHDERDFEFARAFDLPMAMVVEPTQSWMQSNNVTEPSDVDSWPVAFPADGNLVNSFNQSVSLNGLPVDEAKVKIAKWLEAEGKGNETITYKLRDWLFSRQRYWGEPFPIVWDGDVPRAVPADTLPVELPELDDYAPKIVADDEAQLPEPPLGRAEDWRKVTLDLGDGAREFQRELNTMPQWAGSCWYYLRYADPTNNTELIDKRNDLYWSDNAAKAGMVDLYVGGVEHAVLHLLYSRFWHKVLHDLGHVSTIEPFQRLFNQGYILADSFQDSRGIYVDAKAVVEKDGEYFYEGEKVTRQTGKMGKSLKNSVDPDDIYRDYGADSLRLYEMSMGPLDSGRPWTDQGIVGLYRFLQRVWRLVVDEETGEVHVTEEDADIDSQRLLHKTIAGVSEDLGELRVNTAIAKLIELVNHFTSTGKPMDRTSAEATTLMLAPLAPHMAEELWALLGHDKSLTWHAFPEVNPDLLVADTVEIAVQVQGKVRARITVPSDAAAADVEKIALADDNVARHLDGKTVRKVIVVPGRMVNIVAG